MDMYAGTEREVELSLTLCISQISKTINGYIKASGLSEYEFTTTIGEIATQRTIINSLPSSRTVSVDVGTFTFNLYTEVALSLPDLQKFVQFFHN
jgi:hypothetical protein